MNTIRETIGRMYGKAEDRPIRDMLTVPHDHAKVVIDGVKATNGSDPIVIFFGDARIEFNPLGGRIYHVWYNSPRTDFTTVLMSNHIGISFDNEGGHIHLGGSDIIVFWAEDDE